jgi:hypothetical protein
MDTNIRSEIPLLGGIVNDMVFPGIYAIVIIQAAAYRNDVSGF